MDLEKLNTTQIILLVLLVSFVTSIATGIVTVTLMDQAPPAITQTINRIVERTVEKVVPEKSQGATVVKTIVVKEESLIADAISKNSGNVVEIFILKDTTLTEDTDGNKKTELLLGEFVALGFVISGDGMILTDSALVSNNGAYAVKTSKDTTYNISLLTQNETEGVALLMIDSKNGENIGFSAPPLADSDQIKLGQSVISINKKDELSVLTGIVSRLQKGQRILSGSTSIDLGNTESEEGNKEDIKMESYLASIYTTLGLSQSGSVLLDTDGNIIGMNIQREGIAFSVPSNIIREIILSSQKTHAKQVSEVGVQE